MTSPDYNRSSIGITRSYTNHEKATFASTRDHPPFNPCDPNRVEAYFLALDEWTSKCKVPLENQAMTCLAASIPEMRDSVRAYVNGLDRLKVQNWREEVHVNDVVYHHMKQCEANIVANDLQTNTLHSIVEYLTNVDKHHVDRSAFLAKGKGKGGDEDEATTMQVMKVKPATMIRAEAVIEYKKDTTNPKWHDYEADDLLTAEQVLDKFTSSVPTGDHKTFGKNEDADDKHTYGNKMTSGLDFFREVLKTKHTRPSPVVWSQKWTDFSNHRRKMGTRDIGWLRYFDLFEHKKNVLLEDKGNPNYTMDDTTLATQLWTHAGLSESELKDLAAQNKNFGTLPYAELKQLLKSVFMDIKDYGLALRSTSSLAVRYCCDDYGQWYEDQDGHVHIASDVELNTEDYVQTGESYYVDYSNNYQAFAPDSDPGYDNYYNDDYSWYGGNYYTQDDAAYGTFGYQDEWTLTPEDEAYVNRVAADESISLEEPDQWQEPTDETVMWVKNHQLDIYEPFEWEMQGEGEAAAWFVSKRRAPGWKSKRVPWRPRKQQRFRRLDRMAKQRRDATIRSKGRSSRGKGKGKPFSGKYVDNANFGKGKGKKGGKGKPFYGKSPSFGKDQDFSSFGQGKPSKFGKGKGKKGKSKGFGKKGKGAFFSDSYDAFAVMAGDDGALSGAHGAQREMQQMALTEQLESDVHQYESNYNTPVVALGAYEHAAFVHLKDSELVLDPGCSKACISEYRMRKLVSALRKIGVTEPISESKETTTKFNFADGLGVPTHAARKDTIRCVISQKPLTTDMEILARGKTPGLVSLPQMENLFMTVYYRPDWAGGSLASSDIIGWQNKPLKKVNGAHVIDFADIHPPFVGHVSNSSEEELKQSSTVHTQDLTPTAMVETMAAGGLSGSCLTAVPREIGADGVSRGAGVQDGHEQHVNATQGHDVEQVSRGDRLMPRAGNVCDDTCTECESICSTEEMLAQLEELAALSEQWIADSNLPPAQRRWTDANEVPIGQLRDCMQNADFVDEVRFCQEEDQWSVRLGNDVFPVVDEKGIPVDCVKEEVKIWTRPEITQLHETWYHAHAEQVYRKIQAAGVQPPTLAEIKEVTNACKHKHCQFKRKQPSRPKSSGLQPKHRNQWVGQDTFVVHARGRKWQVQHRIDCLTKFPMMNIFRDAQTAKQALKTARRWATLFGNEGNTLTDNGREYVNDEFTDWMARHGMKHYTTPVYSAWANGMCERAHLPAKILIEFLSEEYPTLSMEDVVEVTELALSQDVKSNGLTPQEMMLGKRIKRIETLEMPETWQDASEEYHRIFEHAQLEAERELVRLRGDDVLRKALKARINRATGNFAPGDEVWWFRVGNPAQVKPGWVGPAKVIARMGRNTLVVYGGKCIMVHETRIRPYGYVTLPEGKEPRNVPPGEVPTEREVETDRPVDTEPIPLAELNDPVADVVPIGAAPEGGGLQAGGEVGEILIEGLPTQNDPLLQEELPEVQQTGVPHFDMGQDPDDFVSPEAHRGADTEFFRIHTRSTGGVLAPRTDDGRPPISSSPVPLDWFEQTPPQDFPEMDEDQRDMTIHGIGRQPEFPDDPEEIAKLRPKAKVAPAATRRGRPPGSKNKSKDDVEAERSRSPKAPKAAKKRQAKRSPPRFKTHPGVPESDADVIQMPHPAIPKPSKKTTRKPHGARFVDDDDPQNVPAEPHPCQVWTDAVAYQGTFGYPDGDGNDGTFGCHGDVEKNGLESECRDAHASVTRDAVDVPEEDDASTSSSEGSEPEPLDPWSLIGRLMPADGELDCSAIASGHFLVNFANFMKDTLHACVNETNDLCEKSIREEFIKRQKVFWADLSMLDLLSAREFAFKSQLITEDTPMRELRRDEIENYSELVNAAKETEYDSFAENEVFEITERKNWMKVISSRELIQWKIPRKKAKCRVVIRGFEDRRVGLDTDSPTLRPESFKLLLQYAADHDLEQYKIDLKTAFLQGDAYEGEDKIYWMPPEGFRKYWGMQPNEVAVALKSIYGLKDAPRRWFERLSRTLQDPNIMTKYGLTPMRRHWLDACLFQAYGSEPAADVTFGSQGKSSEKEKFPADYPRFGDLGVSSARFSIPYDRKPTLALGMHVDDLICVGSSDELDKLLVLLQKEFTVGTCEWNDFKYRGLDISRKPCKGKQGRVTSVSMKEYINREVTVPKWEAPIRTRNTKVAKELLSNRDQALYRSLNGKLQWCTTQLRPEVAVRVSQQASKYGKALCEDAVTLNSIVGELRERDIEMTYEPLDKRPLGVHESGARRRLKPVVDASFKHKDEPDLKARGGYLMTLASTKKGNHKVALLGWQSKKFLRVCKSPTGAEVLSISGIIDETDFVKHLVDSFYGPDVQEMSYVLTDSGSATTSQDKLTGKANANLHPDLCLIKQRVANREYRLFHILGENNPADGLTKVGKKEQMPLLKFLSTYELTEEGSSELEPLYFAQSLAFESNLPKWFFQNYAKGGYQGGIPWDASELMWWN